MAEAPVDVVARALSNGLGWKMDGFVKSLARAALAAIDAAGYAVVPKEPSE